MGDMPLGVPVGIILTALLGRPIHYGWHYSLSDPALWKWRKRAEWQHTFVINTLYFLPMSSMTCFLKFLRCDFPTVMDCILELWARIGTPVFLKFLSSWFSLEQQERSQDGWLHDIGFIAHTYKGYLEEQVTPKQMHHQKNLAPSWIITSA